MVLVITCMIFLYDLDPKESKTGGMKCHFLKVPAQAINVKHTLNFQTAEMEDKTCDFGNLPIPINSDVLSMLCLL